MSTAMLIPTRRPSEPAHEPSTPPRSASTGAFTMTCRRAWSFTRAFTQSADGCGLAGPQVGEMRQIVVIDVDWAGKNSKKNPYVLINPQIVTADGPEIEGSEGCLSFPGVNVRVSRPSHVVVRARNLDGDLMQYEAADNLMAVCLQHEIDHVHGVTMFDHLAPMARAEAERAYEEALAAGAKPGDTEV